MIAKYISFGLLSIMLGSAAVHAQKFDIKKLSTNEGLPGGQVGYVEQDEQGFIWMSTYYGLVRYDGNEIKTYTTEDGLRSNSVYHVYLNQNEELMLSTEESGVAYLQGDSLVYPEHFSQLDTLTVTYITESGDGRMWFSTYEQGVFIWDGHQFNQLSTEEGLPSEITWHIRFAENGDAWIGTQEGLAIYNGDSVKVVDASNGLSGNAVYSFAEEDDGTVWISGSSGATTFYDGQWNQIKTINGKELGYVYDVHVDREGHVWIATERKGIFWNDGQEFTHITKTNGLNSNYVYTFNEDREGRVWIATDENGVSIIRDKNVRIFNTPEFISGLSVNIIHRQQDELWIGTEAGVTRFSEIGNSVHYQLPDSLVMYHEIYDIDEHPNGNLLVLNSNSKLLEFDGNQFHNFGKQINLPWVYIQDILVDGETIWLATETGLMKYENGSYYTYSTNEGMTGNYVMSLYQDNSGAIWAVSSNGVNKAGKDTIDVSYTFESSGSGVVSLITQDPKGDFWIGTDDGFSRLKIDERGMPVDKTDFYLDERYLQQAQFIEFDQQGNMWLGSSGGIHFFNKGKLEQADGGLIHGVFMPLSEYGNGVEMNYLSSLRDENGNLWFGSYSHGLIQYKAGEKPELKLPPKVFLRSVEVNGIPFSSDSLQEKELSYNQNNLRFQYGAFDYEYPNRVVYKYRLRGLQSSWQKVVDVTEVSYPHLPAGQYQFELKAKGIQSDWGEPVELAAFTIQKPFWETSWFYGIAGFGIIAIVAAVVKGLLVYYERSKLEAEVAVKTGELQKTLNEKDILIKEIHHRVKNNMAVVSGLLELQGWQISDPQAKKAIENSKLRIQTMSAIHQKLYQNDNLANVEFKAFANDLVKNISHSMQNSDKEIDVTMDIEDVELTVHLAIPCGLILNEALSNSFEHAFRDRERGEIYISFKQKDDSQFHMLIKDNGIGMPEEAIEGQRSSLGITLIQSLSEQIKARLVIKNEGGTIIDLVLPKEL